MASKTRKLPRPFKGIGETEVNELRAALRVLTDTLLAKAPQAELLARIGALERALRVAVTSLKVRFALLWQRVQEEDAEEVAIRKKWMADTMGTLFIKAFQPLLEIPKGSIMEVAGPRGVTVRLSDSYQIVHIGVSLSEFRGSDAHKDLSAALAATINLAVDRVAERGKLPDWMTKASPKPEEEVEPLSLYIGSYVLEVLRALSEAAEARDRQERLAAALEAYRWLCAAETDEWKEIPEEEDAILEEIREYVYPASAEAPPNLIESMAVCFYLLAVAHSKPRTTWHVRFYLDGITSFFPVGVSRDAEMGEGRIEKRRAIRKLLDDTREDIERWEQASRREAYSVDFPACQPDPRNEGVHFGVSRGVTVTVDTARRIVDVGVANDVRLHSLSEAVQAAYNDASGRETALRRARVIPHHAA